ncbi:uncharacterized protein LOC110710038 [Chenopodium quinoa]|nr:uncharacterized protein LOC110710038 [Chenopodium quinoa]
MVKLLLKQNRIEVSSVNKKGLTALDCHLLRRKVIKMCWCREVTKKWPNGDEIGPALENAKALRAKDTQKIKKREKQVKDQSNALMVAASVIAAMAFEFCVSPSDRSLHLLVSNTIALASSLSVIILLIGGLPYSRIFVRVLRITMWIAVSAIAMTYITSIRMLADYRWSTLLVTLMYTSVVWSSVMAILILTHTHNFLFNFVINHPTLRSFFSNYLCCACVNDEKAVEQV